MKNLHTLAASALIFTAAFLLPHTSLHAQPDSLKLAPLDSLMNRYYEAMMPMLNAEKAAECDFLIESCADSLTRRHVALFLFDKYRNSNLMGEEEVAIYLYDKWFATKKIAMRSEFDELDADIFVRFNRNTLIGDKAPAVTLRKTCLGKKTIPETGTSHLLFFYDVSCAKCRYESALLPSALAAVDFPLVLDAVYTGTSRKEWREFRKTFKLSCPFVTVRHFWDPGMDSNYQLLYGVISTPKMYMTEPSGSIIGRRLECESLAALLPYAAVLDKLYRESSKDLHIK
ncbi:MAG: hypothetical protein J5764_06715 [Bacteroidales bacterium]|nr:hypothetical protein [Bacteroidales bacterium]